MARRTRQAAMTPSAGTDRRKSTAGDLRAQAGEGHRADGRTDGRHTGASRRPAARPPARTARRPPGHASLKDDGTGP